MGRIYDLGEEPGEAKKHQNTYLPKPSVNEAIGKPYLILERRKSWLG